MTEKIPAIVLGGTGYVSGELLRLIAAHPFIELRAILSDSQPGEAVAKSFAHLAPVYPELKFSSLEQIKELVGSLPECAILSAAPHGVAAQLIDDLLKVAESKGTKPRVIDISADYRYSTASAYEAVYKHAHGAPSRIAQFTCAVPEHLDKLSTPHVAHPGCFATAVLLSSVPLLKLDLVEPRLFVSGITGSTGSGRTPVAGTHHPQRHSDLYAYNPLSHRHTPEITALAQAASDVAAEFNFVPHSGPFARGIHVTLQAVAKRPIKTAELQDALKGFYRGRPFVRVGADMPHIKDIASSNYAFLSAAANGSSVVVMCAVDNLTKGAAGGAMQWLNRVFGFEETAGLTAPAPGWT
ncbi:N-acetyl-gamma-glutamyl-phosphate reductase [Povalibacter uvarum]|uniref:N-acetyl-gamma-glutamyl-phosphate reductase n=1 Tax=Povalibacter uvarum TaxID=732238 RepID=A0A841HIS0_9GAMM|nr:N-acetyl-gamma-glutamyl-phosphate reductase [Povalibacter uvarum]MBB6092706.1 N-acetyl-gamma-glutamyl-phosphate reductase [Povalibacter uvarum]